MAAEDAPARAIADALERVADAAARRRAAAATLLGMAATDLAALAYVRRAGETSPGALARALLVSSSGATAVIRRLTDAGLLQRSAGPANHRDVRLRLTPRGRALQEPGAAAWDGDVAALAGTLDGEASAAVAAALARLADLAERHADALAETARAAAAGAIPSPVRWG